MAEPEKEAPPAVSSSATEQAIATSDQLTSLTKAAGHGGIFQSPKSQAMLELEDTGIRGGGMVLLRVIVSGLEADVRRMEAKCEALQKECDSWRERNFSEKQKSAVLETQILAITRQKILQSILLTVGGAGGGLGAKLLMDERLGQGLLLLLMGIVFLSAGWLWPLGFSKKQGQ